ncbi:hypothetical protein AB0O42_29475 [Streptomyces sp. NPDC089922]|uniref:DUF6414 family protein n=1 Tax=Streptomyces sp. NPDC089922 TaxID=3155189 RepID=UPI003441BBA7
MPQYKLAHPLYLDVQMMVSFLAYLEGGVYVSSEETLQKETLRGAGGASGPKLPSLGALLGHEASILRGADKHIGETAETKVARHHTAASLFNALYGFLHEDDAIAVLQSPEHLSQVSAGDFVRLSGRYTGNPLEELLAVFSQWVAYMEDMSQGVDGARTQKNKKSGNPQVRAAAQQESPLVETAEQFQHIVKSMEMRMIMKMKEELESCPVHDVVLETPEGVKAVLTVASEYYDDAVAEKLSSGDFSVLGKVTRILREGECVNLSRRTVMGKMGDDGESFAVTMANLAGFNLQSNEPLVRYPAVQILPMAIFV